MEQPKREKYARDKISIKHHTLLEGIGFNWEISAPVEEIIAPAVDEVDQNHEEVEEGDERTEEAKKMPTFKKSLYDDDIMDHPCVQERNAEYERTWNEHYAQLIGKSYMFSQSSPPYCVSALPILMQSLNVNMDIVLLEDHTI